MKLTKIALIVLCYAFGNAAYADEQAAGSSDLAQPVAAIAEGLSDFQWFRVFPYVDKSYTLASAGRLDEALDEVESARNIVPDHLPLVLHHAELLIASDNLQRAIETLQPYLAEPQANRVYVVLLGREDRLARLSPAQFFTELDQLDDSQQASFASAYLSVQGESLNKAQLVRVTDMLKPEQLNTLLGEQLAEYFFQLDAADEVVFFLEPLCRAGREHQSQCSERQRNQLIQALVMSEQFTGIERWLLPLQGHDFDTMLEMTVNRMIGAGRTEELIELLSGMDDQGALSQEWGMVLYRLAVDTGNVSLALSLAQRHPVNCLSHAELLIRDQQLQPATEKLLQCRPAAEEERRYLVLAQQIGAPELLERLSFSSSGTERMRINLLIDHYTAKSQTSDLIRLLEAYEEKDLQMHRRLAQAYYEKGETDKALALTATMWQEHRDTGSLDDHTYMLLNEQRYKDLLQIAVDDSWGINTTHPGNDAISERVSIGIERGHTEVSNSALVSAAQRWPDQRVATQVSEVLVQRQDCAAALTIRSRLQGRAGHQLDSYCMSAPRERLTALEQYADEWDDDEWLRAAVLAYELSDYTKSLNYLENLSADVNRGLYKPLQLSILLAMGQQDNAWTQWQALAAPLTEDELMVGVDIALRRNDRESVSAALQRVEHSADPRISLPLRLRLAEINGDNEQQLELLERLAATSPEEPYYPLAQAFILDRLGGHGSAGLMFDQVFTDFPDTRNLPNLQQAAYTNARARRDGVARQQLQDVIDLGFNQAQQGTEMLARNQRFYREVDSPFSASVAGWLGESTSVSQATGNDFQADYFLSTQLEYDVDYGRERRTNLSVFANLLSAGDSFFFDSNILDIGMAWQPFESHLTFIRLATRTSFDGEGTRLYARASTDLLAGYNSQKDWAEGERIVDHSLYLDWLFFPDEQTSSFYGRYQPTFQFAGAQRSFFKVAAYPFLQYQWTNDTFNQDGLADTRVGLGITWRQPLGNSRYSGWHAFGEVGLEWQHVVDSDIAGATDNGLLLRFAVYF